MRLKFCALIIAITSLWLAFYVSVVMGQEVDMPITVTIINCVDYPEDERCLQFIEPAAEWTPETEVYE